MVTYQTKAKNCIGKIINRICYIWWIFTRQFSKFETDKSDFGNWDFVWWWYVSENGQRYLGINSRRLPAPCSQTCFHLLSPGRAWGMERGAGRWFLKLLKYFRSLLPCSLPLRSKDKYNLNRAA